jgi:hypothetical protein
MERSIRPVTTFGEDSCTTQALAWVLRDHLGPGHHAVAIGSSSQCSKDTYVYDLMQPRGSRLLHADAIATFNDTDNYPGVYYSDVGDLDGDGQPDLLWGEANHGFLIHGPVQGDYYPYGDPPWQQALDLVEGGLPGARFGIGDINGDGIQELTAKFRTDLNEASSEWWMVMFSPHSDPLDPAAGLPIGLRVSISYSTDTLGLWHEDLDGDGLPDLVEDWQYDGWSSGDPSTYPPELEDAGELRIWYGADLLRAWEQR